MLRSVCVFVVVSEEVILKYTCLDAHCSVPIVLWKLNRFRFAETRRTRLLVKKSMS